jgi:hypothetical protein
MLVSMNRYGASGRPRKIFLAAEFGALYAGVPAAYALGWLPVSIIPLLLVMAGGCWLVVRRQGNITPGILVRNKVPALEWRRILGIYALALPLLVFLLWLIKPDALFSLVRGHPKLWVAVMLIYPVV